jgi:hypothetical protein
MNELQEIKNDAIGLVPGETAAVDCVFCKKKGKLSITRIDEGILYNCYSASCTGRGFIGSIPSQLVTNLSKKKEFKPKPMTLATVQPGVDDVMQMWDLYGIEGRTLTKSGWKKIFGKNGYVFPLFNGAGYCYGNTTKYYDSKFKACHYLETDTPKLHYPLLIKGCSTAVLVEDVLSAMRINQDTKFQGVALLGTDLNDEKVSDLLKYGYSNVIIALDPDAHAKGIGHAKKYGLFFNSCKAVCLPHDPKDCMITQLETHLYEDD